MSIWNAPGHMTVREAMEMRGVKFPVLTHPAHGTADVTLVTDTTGAELFRVPETLGRNREDAGSLALIIASIITYCVGSTRTASPAGGSDAE